MGLGCEWHHAWEWWAENFGDFWKKQSVDFWAWARPVQLGTTGCTVRLLGQLVEILTLGQEFSRELTEGRCRNSQHSKNCVSLSSCRKTKSQKKLINVSYLNEESHQCFMYFRISLQLYILHIRIMAMLHTQSDAIHNMSTQLPWRYQPQFKTALVMWYTYLKLALAKVFPNPNTNFELILFQSFVSL